ncbi:MAG: inositol monophosphatase family protein, partial [Aestuariivirgaceae bacterium]
MSSEEKTADLTERYRLAQDVVRKAGELAMRYYGRGEALGVSSKGVQDMVTEADKACEKLIVEAVLDAFPNDSVLGEEGGFQNRRGSVVWVVDPIDGTSNFVRGIPFWCVSLGIVRDRRPVIGVIYDPVNEDFYAAAVGSGAFRNGKAIRPSMVTTLDEATIGLGFSFRRPVGDHARAIETCLSAHCEYNRLGSGALSLAYVGEGRLDGYWEAHMNSWDAAGGIAIVTAAGGYANDFFAGEGLQRGNSILVAAPGVAQQLKK